VAAATEAPLCHQELAAIVARVQKPNPFSVNCSYVHYTQTGQLQWIKEEIDCCFDVSTRSNGVPHSTIGGPDGLQFFWVSGSGLYIWQFSARDGTFTRRGTLPDRYNFTIGLAKLAHSFAVVTQDAVYTLKDDAPHESMVVQTGFLAFQGITRNAVVASYADTIFIANGGTLLTFVNGEVQNQFLVKPLTQIADMQWIAPLRKLLVTNHNQVFLIDTTPMTSPPNAIFNLPTTTTGPRVNTVDRIFWIYIDSGRMYKLDTQNGKLDPANFAIDVTGLLGYAQYFN